MSVSAAGLFPLQSPVGAGHYKPASNTPGGSSAAGGTAASGRGDSVSMSALGQRLTGAAADLFGALDPKARGMLEDMAGSGKISADDVVKGLTAIAKNAAADAFAANGLEKSNRQGEFSAAVVAAGAVSDGFAGQRRSLTAAHGSGAMTPQDYADQMQALTETVTKRQNEILSPFAGTAGQPLVVETGGKPIGLPSELPSDGEQAALEKLAQLGFDKPVYRSAASAYGSQARVSPDKRAVSAPPAADQGGDAAASAPTVSPATASPSAATASPSAATASPSAATASPSAAAALPSAADSRVAAGKAAASMLQAALDGGGRPASALFPSASKAASTGTDDGKTASSLLQTLKDGVAAGGKG